MTDLKTVAIVANIEATAHANASADLFEACKFQECNDALEDSLRALNRGNAALLALATLGLAHD